MKDRTRKLTAMAMFAAIAYVLAAACRIPITSTSFLKYDPKDVALAICGFAMGTPSALLATVAASLIEMITVGTTGLIGCFMNILSSTAFVCTAAAVYRRRHTLGGAVLGLISGVALMTGVMLLWNYFITPYYMGYPREAVAAMLIPVFLPFNLIKGGINAAITLLVYKPVSRALKHTGFLGGSREAEAPRAGRSPLAMIAAALVLVSCVFAVLIMRGVL